MAPSQPILRPNQIPIRVQHHRVNEPINIVRTGITGHVYSQNRRVPENFSNLQEIRLSDIRPIEDNIENNDNIELIAGQNSQTSIVEANLIANIQNSEDERT